MDEATALLQQTLEQQIPITRHMGLRVESYDGNCLHLASPLAPNTNHEMTAFGGSLYSAAVACGWGLLLLKLREAGLSGHVVIHRAEVEYRRPVREDFVAVARVAEGDFERLTRALGRHNRGRLAIRVEVPGRDESAMTLRGEYVVHR